MSEIDVSDVAEGEVQSPVDGAIDTMNAVQPIAEKFLSFISFQEVYAVSISRIKEIIEYEVITHVPLAPDYIRGVINLRGRVVPVVDLSSRLGMQRSEVGKRSCIVIFEVMFGGDSLDIGLAVDAVNEVLDVAQEDLEDVPSFGSNIREDFIEAMAHIDDNFIVLLDIDRVLSVEELADFSN